MHQILFLSNDPVLKRKNIDTLTQNGFIVTEASDALQGLLLIDKDGLEAIIIDEELADIDGYRACQKIRQASEAPIVLLGEEPSEDVWARVDKLGFDFYLKKPINPQELVYYTKAILKRTQQKKSAEEVQPIEIKKTPAVPLPKDRPTKVKNTFKPPKPGEKRRLAGTGAKPATDIVPFEKQLEQPTTADVVHPPPISPEPPQMAAATAQAESIETLIADLELQVANLKTAIFKISHLQKRIEETETIIQQHIQSLQVVENQLQDVNDQLNNIWDKSGLPDIHCQ